MGINFREYASREYARVHGSSVIDHRVRLELSITTDQYCLLDMIHRIQATDKLLSYDRVYRWVGLGKTEYVEALRVLYKENLIVKEKTLDKDGKSIIKYKISLRYQKIKNSKMDDDFGWFWEKSKTNMWKGSKQNAKQLFKKAVAKFGIEYILKQKVLYFEYLDLPENDYLHCMHATTFLSMSDMRFAEPYDEYIQNANKGKKDNKEVQPHQTKSMTKKDHDSYFG